MTRTTNPTPTLIDIGSTANNGLGTNLREGGDIINRNFQDVYTAVNAINDYILPTATTSTKGGVIVDGTSVTITNGVISAHASGGTSVSPSTTLPIIESGSGSIGTSLAYARADHVHPAASGGTVIPTGVIVMWSGSVASIPTGWVLCDGNNGTPNLRDRFIIGAGTTYTVGTTGGSADAIVVSHSHTLGAATFTGTAMSAHSHSITDPGHTHSINDVGTANGDGNNIDSAPTATTQRIFTVPSATTGITVNSASAGTPAGTIGGSSDTTGSSGVGKNIPPYYALAFIMKS